MRGQGAALRRILDGIYLIAGYLAGLFLIIVFLLMAAMSLGRGFSLNIPAGDDFAAWSMCAMAFLGLAHTFKSGELIRIGLVIDRLPPRARYVVELICLLIGTATIGFFAWHAVIMTYQSYEFEDVSQGVVAVPLWIPQLGYSVGLVILAIAFVDELVRVIAGNKPCYVKDPPATPEELVARAAEGAV
jgi:TRAP-type C4-dicarboxylate transport system permease small subunit